MRDTSAEPVSTSNDPLLVTICMGPVMMRDEEGLMRFLRVIEKVVEEGQPEVAQCSVILKLVTLPLIENETIEHASLVVPL